MKAGLLLNDLFSMHRNMDVDGRLHIPRGEILNRIEVANELPFIRHAGLIGAARWFDAVVSDPQRLLMGLLSWCESSGAELRSQTEAIGVLSCGGGVQGVRLRDRYSAKHYDVRAKCVANASGQWLAHVKEESGLAVSQPPSACWGWNLLFSSPFECQHAVAVKTGDGDPQYRFAVPWQNSVLIGTGYHPVCGRGEKQDEPRRSIRSFLNNLQGSLPGVELTEERISRVFLGQLPNAGRRTVNLLNRPYVFDHKDIGLKGLVSVWGIKYTTARSLATRVLETLYPGLTRLRIEYKPPSYPSGIGAIEAELRELVTIREPDRARVRDAAKAVLGTCDVTDSLSLADMIFRRTGLGDHLDVAEKLARPLAELMPWPETRRETEIQVFQEELLKHRHRMTLSGS